jgi:hypothetical protein
MLNDIWCNRLIGRNAISSVSVHVAEREVGGSRRLVSQYSPRARGSVRQATGGQCRVALIVTLTSHKSFVVI